MLNAVLWMNGSNPWNPVRNLSLWASIMRDVELSLMSFYTGQKKHYPPGNRHASQLEKCLVYRS